MRNLARILLVFLLIVSIVDEVKSLDLTGDLVVGANYDVGDDVIVQENVLFEAHDINVTDSLRISNFGEIRGGINICSGCVLELQNSGVFNANVSLQSGARLVQVISSSESATDIGLLSGFDVSVRNADNLDLTRIIQVASNANALEISNSQINAGNMTGFSALSGVSLDGNIMLSFDDVSNVPVLLFSDVSGDAVVRVESNMLDRLYSFKTYKIDNDIFVRLVRSTDYARILNNDMGRFLNDLRSSHIDDKLFSKLDVASSINEINSIISHSVRLNPIKLMQPLSLINSYKAQEIMHIDEDTVFGIEPIAIFSSDVFMNGIRPNASFNISKDLHLKLSGYVMNIDYSDNLNDYDALAFGLGADIQYDLLNSNFVRAHFVGGKSYFDVGPVFADGKVVNNPDGTSMYASGDFGHTFRLDSGYILSPFISFGTEYMAIVDTSDFHSYGAVGTDIGYEYKFDGLQYNYSGRVMVRTDGTIGCGMNFWVWSIFDAAGADMHIGTIYNNDFGTSLMLSLNGRFVF